MEDRFGRKVDSMRISVTDRCNMRCFYCLAGDHLDLQPKEQILSLEEIEEVINGALEVGISRFRFTGGEPLVRRGVVELIERVGADPRVKALGLTTNATELEGLLDRLHTAGVRNLNISIDSLRSDRFAQITRGGRLDRVWSAIMAAAAHGGFNVKLNCVMMRGFNHDELPEMAALTLQHRLSVRFIEYMPVGEWQQDQVMTRLVTDIAEDADNDFIARGGLDAAKDFLSRTPQEQMYSVDEFKLELSQRYEIEEAPEGPGGSGPAAYFKLKGGLGYVGAISPVFNPFCENCNRIRLTSDGRVKSCLLQDERSDIKSLLRRDDYTRTMLVERLKESIWNKPERHDSSRNFDMSTVGG